MSPSRRLADQPFYIRCFRFVSAPLVDGHTGRLSITRLLAVAGFGLLWHSVEADHAISGTQLTLYIVVMSAAFGKSTFGYFLTRYQMQQSLTETRTETTNHEIIERRDLTRGQEPTPN